MRCLLLFWVAALAARAAPAGGLVYRGEAVGLRADGPVAFAVHPADATLALRGRLIFLEHQLPAGRRYNGTVELLRYLVDGDCFVMLQATAFASCPRVANDAFRSCLHADTRPARSERRVSAAIENHVLFSIAGPRPADSGLYFLRVSIDGGAEGTARRRDVFPLAAFVHSFDGPGSDDPEAATARPGGAAGAIAAHCERGLDAGSASLYDRAMTAFPAGAAAATPTPAADGGGEGVATPGRAGETSETGTRASLTPGPAAPPPPPAPPPAPADNSSSRAPSAAGAAAQPPRDTPARFQRQLASILVPLCVLVLLLLALCAAMANCAMRRRLLPCSRRIYRPRTCAACGSSTCAGRPPCRGAAPIAPATVVTLESRPKAPPLATISEE
nr:US7 [Bubaline alphaherpesvirus 1]